VRRHGAGAGIGEQVNENVGCGEKKDIVVCGTKKRFTLAARGPADRLDALKAEWLDDGARH